MLWKISFFCFNIFHPIFTQLVINVRNQVRKICWLYILILVSRCYANNRLNLDMFRFWPSRIQLILIKWIPFKRRVFFFSFYIQENCFTSMYLPLWSQTNIFPTSLAGIFWNTYTYFSADINSIILAHYFCLL